MKRFLLFLLAILSCSTLLFSQKIQAVSFTASSETLSFPFTRYSPFNPAFKAGVSLYSIETERSLQLFNLNLGAYHHQKVETAFYLEAQYLYSYKVKNTVGIDAVGGMAYLHSFYPGSLYEQNSETGDFQKTVQSGRPHFALNTGIGLSYIKHPYIKPFIKQEVIIETPFANTVPAITHSLISVGAYFKINRHENN